LNPSALSDGTNQRTTGDSRRGEPLHQRSHWTCYRTTRDCDYLAAAFLVGLAVPDRVTRSPSIVSWTSSMSRATSSERRKAPTIRLLQQNRPEADSCTASNCSAIRSPRRRARATSAVRRVQAPWQS
jgi:hypothetical protein